MLEDAFVTRDAEAAAELFEQDAVLAAGGGGPPARGGDHIARLLAAIWHANHTFVAQPQRILQASGTALVLADASISVVRRGGDGAWRYAISFLSLEHDSKEQTMQSLDHARSLEPIAVRKDEGEARWWFGGLVEMKATAADTGGQMTILEVTFGPGFEAPLHVHYRDDEGFWILEGGATFEIGDTSIEASAGDYLFGPRDIPHRFTVGPEGCRMLFIMVPGGMEESVRATSEPARSRTLPPPPEREPTPEEMDALKRTVKEHGYELLV